MVGLKRVEAAWVSRETFLVDSVFSKAPTAKSSWDQTHTLRHVTCCAGSFWGYKGRLRLKEPNGKFFGEGYCWQAGHFSHSWWRQEVPLVWRNSREPPRKLHPYPLKFGTITSFTTEKICIGCGWSCPNADKGDRAERGRIYIPTGGTKLHTSLGQLRNFWRCRPWGSQHGQLDARGWGRNKGVDFTSALPEAA